MTAAVWLIVAGFAVWVGLRLVPGDVAFFWVQLVAFTPYVALSSPLALGVALVFRRWAAAAAALVVCVILAVLVLPRALGEDPPGGGGPHVRVLSMNVLVGGVPADRIVGLIRETRADVVAFQELTPAAVARMEQAGIDALLPHKVLEARPGTGGSGIYSRFPATRVGLLDFGGFGQVIGRLDVEGAPVEVVSVHPCAPYRAASHSCWAEGLTALSRTGGPARILAGDFNATLDHARMRDLLDSGYRDAADVTGDGLETTWPVIPRRFHGLLPIPPVTLDHVMVDERTAVHAFAVHVLPDTDHKAVFAALELPPG
ncbi:endonuclease/exonuclease/phosphatase family protein [Herbidospora mongoliensis]|uniref:endonuclease/exonuclease/phosphatase family protein n=1 Tax=Herbidospora mongoliensis TaxID=688067 RepID=UPI00082A32ED|nr:endonuclease/exonuclease/phosphatase family protein [Herbidospora mongoliensis]